MAKKQSFETAFNELKEITALLESGDINIDESLKKYKKGIELIRNCNKILENAKLQIETIDMEEKESKSEE